PALCPLATRRPLVPYPPLFRSDQVRRHGAMVAYRPGPVRPVRGGPGVCSGMSTYLFTFRPPAGYTPSADTFGAWSSWQLELGARDRKSTRLNSSHEWISYAVCC